MVLYPGRTCRSYGTGRFLRQTAECPFYTTLAALCFLQRPGITRQNLILHNSSCKKTITHESNSEALMEPCNSLVRGTALEYPAGLGAIPQCKSRSWLAVVHFHDCFVGRFPCMFTIYIFLLII